MRSLTVSVVGPSSNGAQDGSLTITTSGGAGGYQYAISPNFNEFFTSNVFTGLAAGDYSILAQDQNGCTFLSDVVVTEPTVLNAVLIQTQASCVAGSTIEANVTGGLPPYQYAINGGAFGATNTFSGLPAGNYTVEVRDVNNTSATYTITIMAIPPITVTYTTQDVTCNGMQDGFILAEAVGGTGIYEYELTKDGVNYPYQISNIFQGLAPGSYNVSVRDSGGCISSLFTIAIQELPPLELTYISTNPSDFNTPDGSITLTAAGGGGDYDYSIDGGLTFSSSNTFENLLPGQYQLAAIDSFVCLIELGTIKLNETSELALSAVVQSQISCNSNASVLLTPSGGVPPYEYSSGGSSYRTTNPFITGSAGSKTFTVRDATGATATSNAVTITATPESISVNVRTSYDCNGLDLPKVSFQLTRGSGNMQYSIFDGVWQTSPEFLDVPDGSYTASAKNDSCQVNFTIDVANVVPVNVRVLEQNEGWVKFQIISGIGPFDYRIDGYSGPRIEIGNETIFEVDGFSPGPHWLVVDAANCSDHVTFDIEGFIPELEVVTEVTNASCFGNTDGSISVTGVGGLGEYNYGLVDGDNNVIYNVRPEITNFQGLAPGTYKALLRDTRQGLLVRSELITITEPTQLQVGLDSVSGSQANSNTGIAALTILGGTAPYEFSLNGNAQFSSLEDAKIPNLASGNYVAALRDANGCQTDISFEIRVLLEPSVSVEVEYPTCGENMVTIVATDGSGDYLYALDSTDIVDSQNSNQFNNIRLGGHTATVFDANGYMKIVDFVIEASLPLQFDAKVVYNTDKTNASADLEVQGGNAPYAFSSDGISYQTAATFQDLTEGEHLLYVLDAIGCIAETTVTVELSDSSNAIIDDEKEADIVIFQNQGRTEVVTLVWESITEIPDELNIYNSKGNLIYSTKMSAVDLQTELNVANLARGIYYIYFKTGDKEEVKKVLIK